MITTPYRGGVGGPPPLVQLWPNLAKKCTGGGLPPLWTLYQSSRGDPPLWYIFSTQFQYEGHPQTPCTKKYVKKIVREWPCTLGHPPPLVHYLGGGDGQTVFHLMCFDLSHLWCDHPFASLG